MFLLILCVEPLPLRGMPREPARIKHFKNNIQFKNLALWNFLI